MNNRIREVRLSKGLSQDALGRLVNASQQMISKVEMDIGFARADLLILIAKNLDVSLDYLVGLSEYRSFYDMEKYGIEDSDILKKAIENLLKLDLTYISIVSNLAEQLYGAQVLNKK